MANQPGRRRNRLSLPGQRIDMSGDTLRQLLSPEAASVSPEHTEFIMKEVQPVQESVYSESTNMNITEPEADESSYGHFSSSNMNITDPGADEGQYGHSESSNMNVTERREERSHTSSLVSDYGQRGRDHYRSGSSNPVSDETDTGSALEERQKEVINTDGPGDINEIVDDIERNIIQGSSTPLSRGHSLQRQHNAPRNQVENHHFNSPRANLQVPQNTGHSIEQDLNNVQEQEYQSSFKIGSSLFSDGGYLRDILSSIISSPWSVKDSAKHNGNLEELLQSILALSQQEGSEKLELINSLHTRLSITNPADTGSESIEDMLLNLIQKVYKFDPDAEDASFPSLHSFILMLNKSKGKNSLDQTCQQPSQHSPNYEMIAILEADCCDPHCSRSLCQMVQQHLRRWRDNEAPVTDLTSDEQQVLFSMYDHCRSCEYLHCPQYWCQKEALNWITDDKEILAKMKQLAEHGYHGNFLHDMAKGTFAKEFLQDSPLTTIPKEPQDWQGLFRLQGANNTILAMSPDHDISKYWIIKKCRMYKSHSQVDLYETLRQVSQRGIAQHLWTAFCLDTRYMAVCMGFETFSLYERLQESPMKNLHNIIKIMVQLIHTTQHLHDKDILYLNWSSKNIVYTTLDHFKLTNFTCSALKSRVDEDIADIIRSLPRHLIAPEMLQDKPEADEMTDIRGLGCLLKEIYSGQPVWYEHLHEETKVLNKKIKEGNPPRPDICLELIPTLKACLGERQLRPSFDELESLLLDAKRQHK